MRRPITVDEVVSGLRALADEYEAGYRAVPQPGEGMRRAAGVPVVPIVVHDALCGRATRGGWMICGTARHCSRSFSSTPF